MIPIEELLNDNYSDSHLLYSNVDDNESVNYFIEKNLKKFPFNYIGENYDGPTNYKTGENILNFYGISQNNDNENETIKQNFNLNENKEFDSNKMENQDSKDGKEEQIENIKIQQQKEKNYNEISLEPNNKKEDEIKLKEDPLENEKFINTNKKGEENIKMPPHQYNFEEIKDKLDEKYKKFFKEDKNLEEKINDYNFLNKKRNRTNPPEPIKSKNKKKGRKPKEETKTKNNEDDKNIPKNNELDKNIPKNNEHDKNTPDNIVRKIKTKIFEQLVIFVNIIFTSILKDKIKEYLNVCNEDKKNKNKNEKQKLIKKLNYEYYIQDLKKEKNLEFLDMTIGDLLSLEISPKFCSFPSDSNKKIIEAIKEGEKDNKIIMFILNLKFRDFLDVFTKKKDLKSIDNFDKDKFLVIENKFPKVETILKDIYKKKDEIDDCKYFSSIIYHIYNYERWFFIKISRNKDSNIN